MPAIRVMNWNIEQLSWDKIRIPGMQDAIARTVFGSNIDILVLVELKTNQVDSICTSLVNALNTLSNSTDYYYVLSYPTGGEHYGFIVRNLTMIRPLQFAPNPNAQAPANGTQNQPFTDLTQLIWTTWPTAFPGPVVHPLPKPPRIGLTDAFASRANPRGQKANRTAFGGQPIGTGGYSLGRGFRLPCLALFGIAAAGGTYLIPIVCCHYAAVRSGRNFLAQQQIGQLNFLHIAQLFSFANILAAPLTYLAGYIQTDLPNPGAPANTGYLVQNIIYTGDFNVDFLQNQAGGTWLQSTNHNAMLAITPTPEYGRSTTPPAAAGGVPPGAPPAVPFTVFNPAPVTSNIPPQTLRAACTTQGTHLRQYDPSFHPTNVDQLPDAAFDNFFYGGTQVTVTTPNTGDSADVIEVAGNIEQTGNVGAPPEINLAGPQNFYAVRGTKNATAAPNLAGVAPGAPALTIDDMWIGARLVSDHLPVVLEFTCP